MQVLGNPNVLSLTARNLVPLDVVDIAFFLLSFLSTDGAINFFEGEVAGNR